MTKSLCLYCQSPLQYDLSWDQLIGLRPLQFPVLCLKCSDLFCELAHSETDCRGCQRPMSKTEDEANEYLYCYDCYRWLKLYPEVLLPNASIYQYDDTFSEWLSRYKYHGDIRMAKVMTEPLKKIHTQYAQHHWLILPSSASSLAERGFHSIAMLLDEAEIPYSSPFIYTGDGQKQAKKTRADRIKLKASFKIKSDFSFSHNKYLLFDDVYTTGATMLQAKSLLFQAFQKNKKEIQLDSLTLAHFQENN